MKKILFFGTSFLGAIKQGYDAVFRNSFSATFIGLNAPELAANLDSGWHVTDGFLQFAPEFSCFVSGYDKSAEARIVASKTFPGTEKVAGLLIDLRNYSSIVFVDMFHRLRPAFSVGESCFPVLSGCPVSDNLLAELQTNGSNGWISLDKHPEYGSVPFVNAKRLLIAIKDATEVSSAYLIAAPRPPKGNVDIQAMYGDVPTARRSFDYLESFYTKQLGQQGIEYLPQPMEVLDDDCCLTRPEFSRGEHRRQAGILDEHMNRQYGEMILAKYADRIFTRV